VCPVVHMRYAKKAGMSAAVANLGLLLWDVETGPRGWPEAYQLNHVSLATELEAHCQRHQQAVP
jgi:hypothetical protein